MTAHVKDIPAMFAAGVPVKIIAAEVGLHRVNVYRRLKAEGVRVKPDRERQILTLVNLGLFRASSICKRSGFSRRNTNDYLTSLRHRGLVQMTGFNWSVTEAGRDYLCQEATDRPRNADVSFVEARAGA